MYYVKHAISIRAEYNQNPFKAYLYSITYCTYALNISHTFNVYVRYVKIACTYTVPQAKVHVHTYMYIHVLFVGSNYWPVAAS